MVEKYIITYDISNRSPVGHEGDCCITPSKNQLRRRWYWTPSVPEAALSKTNHGEHYQHVPSSTVNLHLQNKIRNIILVGYYNDDFLYCFICPFFLFGGMLFGGGWRLALSELTYI